MYGRFVAETFDAVAKNISVVWMIVWPSALILFVAQIGLGDVNRLGSDSEVTGQPLGWLLVPIKWVVTAILSVAWVRFLFLGERPSRVHVKFGLTESRYFLASIIITLPMTIAELISGFSGHFQTVQEPQFARPILLLVLLIFGAFIYLRFCLLLPMVAITNIFNFRKSFNLSSGITFEIFINLLVAIIPFAISFFVVIFVSNHIPFLTYVRGDLLVKSFLICLADIVVITVLASAYRNSIERQEAGEV